MKAFTTLNLGFANAENYRRKDNKELLMRYFVRDEYLEKLLDNNIYFLVGEKGTGKTAYSTYLSNNKYKNKNCFVYDVRQTEYQKFLELKKLGHLPLSGYAEVWKVIFLILSATSILEKSNTPEFLRRFTKLGALKKAIDEFYQNAFSPEIVKVINFVESSEETASLLAKYLGNEAKISESDKIEIKDSKTIFQTSLNNITREFQEALDALSLDEDFTIFIDGIDVRPSDIAYNDYFECVRGIIQATWAINNDFFSSIKDSKGRIRVVLLVRPDIFLRAGLHNVNTKIRDNSVFLNWITTYKDHRSSRLFSVADRMLAAQNDGELPTGAAWDYYFDFETENVRYRENQDASGPSSFLSFLRFSYYRPRDINAMMDTMREILSRTGDITQVKREDFDNPSFRDAHADYLLGEIRDQLLFYYSDDDYELFLKFFSNLNGKKKFSYDEYVTAYQAFIYECGIAHKQLPKFFESNEVFLQFLYEQNIICFIETDEDDASAEPFIRWCFRERTPSNLSPKVRTHVQYEIFYGLTKALNVGRRIKTNPIKRDKEVGTVIKVSSNQGFGFIRGGAEQREYYFKIEDVAGTVNLRVGDRVKYTATAKYGKVRARDVEKF